MGKKLIIILIVSQILIAEMGSLSPFISAGIFHSDNIDLVSKNTTAASALDYAGGISWDQYLHPDLKSLMQLSSRVEKFLEKNFGDWENSLLSWDMEYIFLPQLQIGYGISLGKYSDTIIKEQSFTSTSSGPFLKYFFAPESSLQVNYGKGNYVYQLSSIAEQKETIEAIWEYELNDNWGIKLSGDKLNYTAAEVSENYSAQEMGAELQFIASDWYKISLGYGHNIANYTEALVPRIDQGATVYLGNILRMGESLSVRLFVQQFTMDSSEVDREYIERQYTLSVDWAGELLSGFSKSDELAYYSVNAQNYMSQENYSAAEKQWRKVLFWMPEDNDTKYYLANSLQKQKKYSEAIMIYQQVIEQDENYYEAYYALALSYILTDQPGEAKATLQKLQAISGEPSIRELIEELEY